MVEEAGRRDRDREVWKNGRRGAGGPRKIDLRRKKKEEKKQKEQEQKKKQKAF
jgi:hypothetical protein